MVNPAGMSENLNAMAVPVPGPVKKRHVKIFPREMFPRIKNVPVLHLFQRSWLFLDFLLTRKRPAAIPVKLLKKNTTIVAKDAVPAIEKATGQIQILKPKKKADFMDTVKISGGGTFAWVCRYKWFKECLPSGIGSVFING
jgi:hypothetical protein